MAKLSKSDVFKLAQLARTNLSDEQSEHFASEITAILNYVEQLKEAKVDGLKPTNQVTGLTNVWREDKLIDYGYKSEELLKNVPKVKDGFIQVGRVIE